jgi:hypothetical protein
LENVCELYEAKIELFKQEAFQDILAPKIQTHAPAAARMLRLNKGD